MESGKRMTRLQSKNIGMNNTKNFEDELELGKRKSTRMRKSINELTDLEKKKTPQKSQSLNKKQTYKEKKENNKEKQEINESESSENDISVSEESDSLDSQIVFTNLNIDLLDYSKNNNSYANFKEIKNEPLNSKVLMIKCLFELAHNQKFYKLKNSNKTFTFWNAIKEHPYFKNLFNEFTVETLRKYWRILSSIEDINLLMLLLDQYKEKIEKNDLLKFLPLITSLKDFLNSEDAKDNSKFDEILNKFEKKPKIKENIENTHPQLKKKRSRLNKSDIIDVDDVLKIMDEFQETNDNVVYTDEQKMKVLDEVVESLNKHFNNTFDKVFIVDALRMNCLDLNKTFQYLSNPEETYEFFTDQEDEIILKMRNSCLYDELKLIKGDEAVDERENFLRKD